LLLLSLSHAVHQGDLERQVEEKQIVKSFGYKAQTFELTVRVQEPKDFETLKNHSHLQLMFKKYHIWKHKGQRE
jgi:hypothetical protein